MTTAMAVLPPVLSPPEDLFWALCNWVGSVLVGLTELWVRVLVGRVASLVGVTIEVMTMIDV